jgi:hypothetical protein
VSAGRLWYLEAASSAPKYRDSVHAEVQDVQVTGGREVVTMTAMDKNGWVGVALEHHTAARRWKGGIAICLPTTPNAPVIIT